MGPLTKRERASELPTVPARFEPVAGAVIAEKYRVESVLGEGGMGVVVAATHLGLEQRVAIKFLLPEALRNEVAVERFLREARVAAKVRSEHVARVHDVGTVTGGVPYIVMEHLEGQDLGEVIAQQDALPIDEACEMALQACEALTEVHAAGIVHRDLKPSNLFVTRRADGSPVVKLLDFGISKLTFGPDDSGGDPALTATATIMGSPSYMSPEQLKSTKEVDPRSDVWSLGTVLYEAVTGRPAFRGESVPQVCAMIASEPATPPSTFREGIPRRLEAAILACLEKEPGQRISLVELAEILAEFAPARAKPSIERIRAIAGNRPSSGGRAALARKALPVLELATSARGATSAAWSKRGRRPRRGLFVLLALGVGLAGAGIATGRIRIPRFEFRPADSPSQAPPAAPSLASSAEPASPEPSASSGVHTEDRIENAAGTRTDDRTDGVVSEDAAAGPSFAEDEDTDDDVESLPAPEDAGSTRAAAPLPRTPSKPRPLKPHHPGKPNRRHH